MESSYENKVKRKDKIYNKVLELSLSFDLNNINNTENFGFSADEIGQLINVDRTNTSRELNKLLKEEKIVKVKGKPVVFFSKDVLEKWVKLKINKYIFESKRDFYNDIKEFKNANNKMIEKNEISEEDFKYRNHLNTSDITNINKTNNIVLKSDIKYADDIFEIIIGGDKSLKSHINLAKAAIMYPPNGIHTLIVGPTGVGKSTFAEAMYKYAIIIGRIAPNSSFVVFNCADYANNPQMLISQLFGHTKGAFTGADKDKYGLVEYANGGILFLDEIHRLPPEAQEMLFLIIDKGIYRRMGETDKNREVRLLIIGATTEDPYSILLDTFRRRIPNTIELPSLEQRSMEEKAELISQFFLEESSKTKIPIKVSKEVLRAFMFYECKGNIGQLKSDIRLICAKSFFDYISSKAHIIEVKLSHLPSNIRDGLFKFRKEQYTLYQNITINNDIIFDSSKKNVNKFLLEPFDKLQYEKDYYEEIVNNLRYYSISGLSDNDIRNKIENKLEDYFSGFYNKINNKQLSVNNEVLSNLVGQNILDAVEFALNSVYEIYGEAINEQVKCGLALHINNLLGRINSGNSLLHPDKEKIANEHPIEFNAAQKIKYILEEQLKIEIPEEEVIFITMLLYTVKITKDIAHIGIIIISHGDSVASGMANVVNALLGVNHANAIDMALNESIDATLNKATDLVININRGKGVLILVDMGSLSDFGDIITKKTGIATTSISRVSTLMAIEATRKALLANTDIKSLEKDLNKTFLNNYDSRQLNINKINLKQDIQEDVQEYFRTNLINTLGKTLTFLNPQKIYDGLYIILERICIKFHKELDTNLTVKFMFHCSCMIEREIKNEPLKNKYSNIIKCERELYFRELKKIFRYIEEMFDVKISEGELAYIIQILDTHYNTVIEVC